MLPPRTILALAALLALPQPIPAQRVDRIERSQVAFSPRGDALQNILQELRGARSRVDVAVYYFTNQTLIDALCALSERNIKVRVFVDEDMARASHRRALDKLVHFGATVFVENLPHNGKLHLKTAVIDEHTVITGSANWTETAFTANVEDTLIIRSPALARRYLDAYQWLERHSVPYMAGSYDGADRVSFPSAPRQPRTGGQRRIVAPRASSFPDLMALEVYFSPQQPGLDRFLESLRGAQRSIDVGIYIVTHPQIVEALCQVAARVPVRLLADGTMNTGNRLPILQQMWDAGIEVHYVELGRANFHIKNAVIDGMEVWTGSANWTQGAAAVNAEDMLLLRSPRLARFYTDYLNTLIGHATSFAGIERSAVAQTAPESPRAALAPRGTPAAAAVLPPTGPRRNFRHLSDSPETPRFHVSGRVAYLRNEEYLPVLLDLIRTANQSIMISMFHVAPTTRSPSVDQVLDELGAAAERGLYVYMVLELPSDPSDAQNDNHSGVAERLRARGVDVRLSVPTLRLHEKMVVVDLCKLLIGSHNWSEGALSGGAVYESSALVLLDQQEPRFAQHILRHNILSDMRSREQWENEASLIRHVVGLGRADQERFIRELEASR